MNIMSFWLAKMHQSVDRTDAKPLWSDVYNNSTRASKRQVGVSLYTLRGVLPKNVPDTTQPDDDVYNLGTRSGRVLVDGALSQKSLLPENGTNAKPFLSDVYNKDTRAKKRLAGVSLYGRSMVEMLGVLAIIGVLSVGSISGYQKAMFKYKLNKQSQQITQVLSAMLEYKSLMHEAPNDTATEFVPILIKLNAIPVEMIKNSNVYIYDSFNMKTNIGKGANNLMYFAITMQNFTDPNYKICLNVFNTALPFAKEFHSIGINSTTADKINQQDWWYGDNAENCTKSHKCASKLSITELYKLCEFCDKNSCGIYVAFK